MNINQGIFAVKLKELEQQYGQLLSRLHLCQQEDHAKIRKELERAKDEYAEIGWLLQKQASGSQSAMVSILSSTQRTYCVETRRILEEELPRFMAGEQGGTLADQAEGMTLYAEYAIDFATLSMKQALLAALSAIDLQMNAEEAEKQEDPAVKTGGTYE